MDYLHTRTRTHTDDVLAAMTAKMNDCVLYLAAYRRRQYWRSRRVPWTQGIKRQTERKCRVDIHEIPASRLSPATPRTCMPPSTRSMSWPWRHAFPVSLFLNFRDDDGFLQLFPFLLFFFFSLSRLVSSGLGKRVWHLCDQIDESCRICSEITF